MIKSRKEFESIPGLKQGFFIASGVLGEPSLALSWREAGGTFIAYTSFHVLNVV